MNIHFIGMKEFRQNMASVAAKAVKENLQVIVMRKNKPVFELRPLGTEKKGYADFLRSIREARDDVRRGRTHSAKEVEEMLGL